MSKKFFHFAIGISLIICSVSLLIFAARQNPAMAQPQAVGNDVVVAGTVLVGSGFSADYYIIGYNTRTAEVSVLGKVNPKELKK